MILRQKNIGILLFTISLLIGLFVFRNYGLAWDEPQQRLIGTVNFNYVVNNDPTLQTFEDKDYGPVFELLLISIEKIASLADSRQIYFLRHLVTHIYFLFSCFIFFLLIKNRFKNNFLATIGFLLLVINPVIYGHSFFNSKDIPFLSTLIFCLYLSNISFERKNVSRFSLLGALCALLINIRIMGIIMPLCITSFLIIDAAKSINKKRELKYLICFGGSLFIVLYISCPYLWLNPLENFTSIFNNMKAFRWDNTNFILGKFIRGDEISWWYFPVWFGISVPVLYLLLGVGGLALAFFRIFKNPTKEITSFQTRSRLLDLAIFSGPIIAVIIFHSVLYDSWRQLMFVYPAFILLGIEFLNYLFEFFFSHQTKKIVQALCLIYIIWIGSIMVKHHPHEYVYFNELTKKESEYLRKNFDMDYWGISFRKGLEHIYNTDTSDQINIFCSTMPGRKNLAILTTDQREKLKIVENIDSANYLISNFRWHPEDYPYKPVHSISVFNNAILTVYKLK